MCFFTAKASSPAGVRGVELWMNPTAATHNLQSRYIWHDMGGDSSIWRSGALPYVKPFADVRYVNFNPAIHVEPADSSWIELTRTGLTQFTAFSVLLPDTGMADRALYAIDDEAGTTFRADMKDFNPPHSYPKCRIHAVYHSEAPVFSAWGRPGRSAVSFACEGASFAGYCPELILYGRVLAPYERRLVESFLAMRHGITLNHSYFVGDTLLWDCSENIFHNNVTAIGLDRARGFRQLRSASLHNLSADEFVSSDSYFLGNPYGRPSVSLRLTAGYEDGCAVPDGQYIIWGDNGASLDSHRHYVYPSIQILGRTWCSRTTMPFAGSVPPETLDAENALSLHLGHGRYAMEQADPSKKAVYRRGGYTADGMFSFRQRYRSAAIDVVFANPADVADRFGFRFNADNTVSRIEGSRITALPDTVAHFSRHLQVEKTGTCVRLRIDHFGDSILDISDDAVASASMLTVELHPQPAGALYGAEITDMRIGSLTYTGQQVELSYDGLTGGLRPDHNTALVVNPGNDSFADYTDLTDSTAYYCTAVDTIRRKAIFDGVRLNSFSQTEYFTFAQIDSIHATCAAGEGTTLETTVSYGTPPFRIFLCQYNADGSIKDAQTDVTYSKTHTLTPGTVDEERTDTIFIMEDGWRISAIGDSTARRTLRTSEPNTHSATIYVRLPDHLAEGRSFRIGFARDSVVDYGLAVDGTRVSLVGAPQPDAGTIAELRDGHLKLMYNESGVYWICGNRIIGEISTGGKFHAVVEAVSGPVYLDGVIFDGFGDSFDLSPGVFAAPSRRRCYKAPVSRQALPATYPVGAKARKSPATGGIDDLTGATAASQLAITNRDGMPLAFIAKPGGEASGRPGVFAVFDAAGKMVWRSDYIPGASASARIEFTVPSPGVYVGKLITDTGEYSRKFIANRP